MKTFKALDQKNGAALLVGLVAGLLSATYLSRVVNGITRLISDRTFSAPVNDIVWPLASIIIVFVLLEFAMYAVDYVKSVVPATTGILRKANACSLAVALALAFFLANQLSTVADYFGRLLLALGDGNGAHPMGLKDNLIMPIVAVLIAVALVEVVLYVGRWVKNGK